MRYLAHSLIPLCLIAPLVPAMMFFPADLLTAGLRGLLIWKDVLLPALFPFFVLSELMIGLGIIHLLSVWLEPLMRVAFRLPGSAGLVMLLGFLAGYPMAAKLSAELLKQNKLNHRQASQLSGIATTADPIFIIGAVSIGFFQNQAVAVFLLLGHYGSSLLLALSFRFSHPAESVTFRPVRLIRESVRELRIHRAHDRRSIYGILADALNHSTALILQIGGLVLFFCVYTSLLTSIQWMNYFYYIAKWLFAPVWMVAGDLSLPLVDGIFEVTMGIQKLTEQESVSLLPKLVIAGFLLSWAGLSVHAQIMSMLHESAVRYLPFLFLRIMHGLTSALIVFLTWSWFGPV